VNRETAHLRAGDLRGASRLAIDATLGLTNLVENLHHNILRTPGPLGTPTELPAGGVTGLVYRSIRGVTRLVGGSLDALLGQVNKLLPPATAAPSAEREAVLAALNGVLGDHLAATGNPLAIPMQLCQADGQPLAAPLPPGTRVLLMVHGLCMNPLQWRRKGHGHGAVLAAEGGFMPLYLHYNSGLPIATNGRLLADRLQALQALQAGELVILGHSMGGLVARSACHQGQARGDRWPQRLRAMVFLGTPHHGAPLERGGHGIDLLLGASPYTAAFARLGKLRSAGITDLRHGHLLGDDSAVPLPAGVACYAVAGALGPKPGALKEKLLGDGLVPLDSALGRHRRSSRRLQFAADRQWVGQGINHLDLLSSPEVLTQLRRWLIAPAGGG
jgi:pimeloyl-ACP methyl ester carboxylesterase